MRGPQQPPARIERLRLRLTNYRFRRFHLMLHGSMDLRRCKQLPVRVVSFI